MKKRFVGMTLIELLATTAILGLLTAFAIPSFRGLQGRQDMRVTQGVIQSALYRLDQLALAPPAITQDQGQANDFDIVGYGLVFYPIPRTNYAGTVNLANCTVTATNDFIAVLKYVRDKQNNGDIKPVLMPADPGSNTACSLSSRNHPEDLYVLPTRVRLSVRASSPQLTKPWLITQTLASVGTSVGSLQTGANFTNPFLSFANPVLAVQHATIRQNNQPLCYGVNLSRYSEAVKISSQIKASQGCTNG